VSYQGRSGDRDGIGSVTADGAYDGGPTYDTIGARADNIPVIIAPHVTAVLSVTADRLASRRDQHIAVMAARGRIGWQEETGYGQRAEAKIGVAVLNRMLFAGRPIAVDGSAICAGTNDACSAQLAALRCCAKAGRPKYA